MKQFLLLLGVAAVAGAMYVAAASGSQQSAGPTAKQFNALKKQVATLGKTLKTVKTVANTALGIIATCDLTVSGNNASEVVLPVSVLGSTTDGYMFGTSTATAAPTTALDMVGASPQFNLQVVNPSCVGGALQHALKSGSSRALRLAKNTR